MGVNNLCSDFDSPKMCYRRQRHTTSDPECTRNPELRVDRWAFRFREQIEFACSSYCAQHGPWFTDPSATDSQSVRWGWFGFAAFLLVGLRVRRGIHNCTKKTNFLQSTGGHDRYSDSVFKDPWSRQTFSSVWPSIAVPSSQTISTKCGQKNNETLLRTDTNYFAPFSEFTPKNFCSLQFYGTASTLPLSNFVQQK